MLNAILAVGNELSVNSASKEFHVPRRTLGNYLKKKLILLKEECSMGRKSVLTKEQEEELCNRIVRLAEVGYPLIPKVLRHCVINFSISKMQRWLDDFGLEDS